MTDRPPADALLPVMLEGGRAKLSAGARRHLLAEVRCPPRRHLLAATVRTTGGVWVLWRGALQGAGWASGWDDELDDAAALYTWCKPCRGMVWVVDVTDPARPRCNKPPALR